MTKKVNRTYGVNTSVSIDPTANAASNQSINNNIIIHRTITPPRGVEDVSNPEIERNTQDTPQNLHDPTYVSYPSTVPQVPKYINNTQVQAILYDVAMQILLTQNKTLMANIMTKQNIILSKSDLERVVSAKIDKQCSVTIDDSLTGCGCLTKIVPIMKIASIRIVDDNCSVDFKSVYNADYNELKDIFNVNLKYVCI